MGWLLDLGKAVSVLFLYRLVHILVKSAAEAALSGVVFAIVASFVDLVHDGEDLLPHLLDVESVGVLEPKLAVELRREAVLLVDESLFVLLVKAANCWLFNSALVPLYWIFEVVGAPSKLVRIDAWSAYEAQLFAAVAPWLLPGVGAQRALAAQVPREIFNHPLERGLSLANGRFRFSPRPIASSLHLGSIARHPGPLQRIPDFLATRHRSIVEQRILAQPRRDS